jgi:hypothetical protein
MGGEIWYTCLHQDGTVWPVFQLPLLSELMPYDYYLSRYLEDCVYTNRILARTNINK